MVLKVSRLSENKAAVPWFYNNTPPLPLSLSLSLSLSLYVSSPSAFWSRESLSFSLASPCRLHPRMHSWKRKTFHLYVSTHAAVSSGEYTYPSVVERVVQALLHRKRQREREREREGVPSQRRCQRVYLGKGKGIQTKDIKGRTPSRLLNKERATGDARRETR